jgi:hypothetical protein
MTLDGQPFHHFAQHALLITQCAVHIDPCVDIAMSNLPIATLASALQVQRDLREDVPLDFAGSTVNCGGPRI